MRKLIKLIREKWLRQTSSTILLVAIILVIFLLGNKILDNLNINPFDFTEEKIFSLTDESKESVKSIDKEVNLYFFGFNEESLEVTLGKQYSNVNGKIKVQVLNIEDRPDLVSQYQATSTEQFVAVASEQRYKVIDASEMYITDMSDTSYQLAEQKITNAILEVTIEKKPQIYFLTGHDEFGIGEYSMLSTLSKNLVNEIYDVNSLYLLSADIPEVCDALIISNPARDFTDIETEKIISYINNGGNIIWMQDASVVYDDIKVSTFTNVNRILSLYGISFSDGLVCEQSSSNIFMGTPYMIMPELSYSSITKDLYNDGIVMMLYASKINTSDAETLEGLGVTASPFMRTTDKAYCKEDLSQGIEYTEGVDESGQFVLGEVLEKKIDDEKTSTMIAISDALFTSSQAVLGTELINVGNNGDIVLESVAELSDREDTIKIQKGISEIGYMITETTDTIVRSIVIAIPVVIIALGTIVLIVRKKKHK